MDRAVIQYLQQYNNWAGYIAVTSLLFNLALGASYVVQKDYRRALYFFFAFCITLQVVVGCVFHPRLLYLRGINYIIP